MVDICLSGNVLVALFDLGLRVLVLLCYVALRFFRFSQLYFNVAEGVFEFLVFNFAESQHLSVLNLCAFLAFDAQSSAHNSILLLHHTRPLE